MNCDTNNDGKCDLNCDTNNDGNPEVNIDSDNDGKCDLNCDTDLDGICDVKCDTNNDGICDTNCNVEVDDNKEYYVSLEDIKTLSANNVIPGWSGTSSFKVVNNNSITLQYSLEWINVVNTFSNQYNLDYEISRNGVVVAMGKVPYNTQTILSNEVISPNSVNTYIITYKFANYNEPQDIDQNKNFKANIKIKTK